MVYLNAVIVEFRSCCHKLTSGGIVVVGDKGTELWLFTVKKTESAVFLVIKYVICMIGCKTKVKQV